MILSQQFFEKDWTQYELNGLTAKEIVGEDRVILPVWHEIDEKYLVEVAPTLADRFAARTSEGVDRVVDQIGAAIDRRRAVSGTVSAAAAAAAEPKELPPAEPTVLAESGNRVRRGLSDGELYEGAAEGGPRSGPGWLSVVVGPVKLRDDLLDPTRVDPRDLRNLEVPDLWGAHEKPLIEWDLRADLPGFQSRIPDEGAPSYLLNLGQDGLLEYGTTLTHRDGIIATHSIGSYIHDWTLTFLKVLEFAGYTGEAVANANLWQVEGLTLGTAQMRMFFEKRPITVRDIPGRPLRGLTGELSSEVGRWTKRICDRLFLAGGIPSGAYFIDEEGNLTED